MHRKAHKHIIQVTVLNSVRYSLLAPIREGQILSRSGCFDMSVGVPPQVVSPPLGSFQPHSKHAWL